VEIRVLGPLEVVRDGHAVQISRRQSRTLLGILALDANRPVLPDRLIRSALNPDASTGPRIRLRSGTGGYILEADVVSLDVLRFRDLLHRSTAAGSDENAAELIRAALALWRGPLLGNDTTSEIAAVHGQALESARLSAVENLLDLELRSGKPGHVVDEFLPLVLDNLIREPLVARFLRALHQAGPQHRGPQTVRPVPPLAGQRVRRRSRG
jgi:DNA-binding SARP family transcriptional activator